jgi:AraC-like DNA-binding protein
MARKDSYRIEDWQRMAAETAYQAARLSKKVRLSRRQLERHTQKLFGRSPQAWLDEQRLIKAATVLKERRSVRASAYALGFKQRSHFSRQFKKHYGVWPTEYLAINGDPGRAGRQDMPQERIAAAAINLGCQGV